MNKLKAVAVTALMFSTSAAMASASDWHLSDDGVIAYSFSTANDFGMASVGTTEDKSSIAVAFLLKDARCTSVAAVRSDRGSLEVAGKRVKMLSRCFREGSAMYEPKTPKGYNYVINKFKYENRVQVTDPNTGNKSEFSANGFTSYYDYFNKVIRAESKAL